MSELSTILKMARERGEDEKIAYSGAVLPTEAWSLFQHLPGVKIVDVRTQPEWQFVGVVPNAELIEWRTYPEMERNPDFLTQLRNKIDQESIVLFLCRSGIRSHEAATLAAAHGYTESYNILQGFEGDRDENQRRGQRWGWKAAGLPWVNL